MPASALCRANFCHVTLRGDDKTKITPSHPAHSVHVMEDNMCYIGLKVPPSKIFRCQSQIKLESRQQLL